MNKVKIRVGGVPEHFNCPWHLANENDVFNYAGIKLDWTDYGGGTGAMCKALREDKLDMAIMLTEGAIRDIIQGNPSKIAQFYVTSPLVWGIHVSSKSNFKDVNELKHEKFAISRMGSGSHLMAFVNAEKRGWNPEKLNFKIIQNLEGARKSLAKGSSSAFMWEKFTTKPLVDSSEFNRIGECPTPWPCFVIVVTDKALKEKGNEIKLVLDKMNKTCASFMEWNHSIPIVSQRYKLQYRDVVEWYKDTQWATSPLVPRMVLERVMASLYSLNLIENKVKPEDLCSHLAELSELEFDQIDKVLK